MKFLQSKPVTIGMAIFNFVQLALLFTQIFVYAFANDTGIFVMFLASVLCALYVVFVYARTDNEAEDQAEGERMYAVFKSLRLRKPKG